MRPEKLENNKKRTKLNPAPPAKKRAQVNVKGYRCKNKSVLTPSDTYTILPPSCQPVSPVPAKIAELKQSIKTKNNQQFRLIVAELVDLGVKLFKAAKLKKGARPDDLVYWDDFKYQVSRLKHRIGTVDVFNVIDNPKLDREDALLLLKLIKGDAKKEDQEKIKSRIAECWKSMSQTYNGWVSQEFNTLGGAFLNVLRELYGENKFEGIMVGLTRKNIKAFITATSPKRVEQLLKMNNQRFYHLFKAMADISVKTPPGTNQRIIAVKKMGDFSAIAFAKGLTLSLLERLNLKESIPQLTEKEYKIIEQLSVAKYYGGTYKKSFKKAFIYFAVKYFKSKEDKKPAYSAALQALDGMSSYFMFSAKESDILLQKICKRYKCSLYANGKIGTMRELKNKDSIAVPPEGLPVEVKKVLKKTGYWKLVKDSLCNIGFSPEIKEGTGIGAADTGGHAVPLLRRAMVDFKTQEGKLISAREIAMILVHEAAHVKWRSDNFLLQRSTPNERHAYAVQYAFMQKLRVPKGKEEAKRFILLKAQAYQAVRTANKIMGYQLKDISSNNKQLPSNTYLKSRGLLETTDLDMDYYPTNPPPDFLKDYYSFRRLAWRIDKNINNKTIKLIWNILSGDAILDVKYQARKSSLVKMPRGVLRLKNGAKQLTRAELAALAKFLVSIYKNVDKSIKINNLYFPLLKLGKVVYSKHLETDKKISAVNIYHSSNTIRSILFDAQINLSAKNKYYGAF